MVSHRIVVATHAKDIHFLTFETDPPALNLLSSLQLKEQPSWVEASPTHKDLIYVNSWIENKIFVLKLINDGAEIVSECDSGGAGPTYMKVTLDGKGLMVVNYNGGTLDYLPLSTDGTFSQSKPSPTQIHTFPHSPPAISNERQDDGAHPHHIIQLPDSRDVLVPTLGSDKVWWMRWRDGDGGWEVVDRLDTPGGSGPRHGVLDAKGTHLFLLHELESYISVHKVDPTASAGRISLSIKRVECLPEELRGIRNEYGPYDLIASSIALLPPLPGDLSPHHILIATNRNAPAVLAPEGDTVALYQLPSLEDPSTLSDPLFILSNSDHIRGLLTGPASGEQAQRYVITMGRNRGGLTVWERESGGGLTPLVANVLEKEISLPVGGIWL